MTTTNPPRGDPTDQRDRATMWPGLSLVWAALSIFPIAFAVWFVEGFTLVAPQLDQWELLSFYDRIATGQAHLYDLFAPHNGLHVIFVPRVALAALAFLTHWNLRAEVYVGFVLALLTAWGLNRTLRLSLGNKGNAETVWIVNLFTVFLLFSPAQEWIWTWSEGYFNFLENACVVGTLWALARPTPLVGVAISLCTVASFNRVEGLLSWIILFPAFLNAVARRRVRGPALVVWALAALACWAVCLVLILSRTPAAVGFLHMESPQTLFRRLLFMASLAGVSLSSFTESWIPSPIPSLAFFPAGVLVILAYGALTIRLGVPRESRERATPWILLGAFALAFAASAAMARSGLASATDLHRLLMKYYLSEFAPTSALVAIAALHLLALFVAERSTIWRLPRPLFCRAAAVCGLVVLAANYAHAAPNMIARRLQGHGDRYCIELLAYLAPVNSCMVNPETAVMFERTGLRTVRRDVAFEPSAPPVGGIDHVERAPESHDVVVAGWVALEDEASGTVLLAAGREDHFFAPATRFSRDGRILRWSATVPEHIFDSQQNPVRAWAYERKANRFRLLDGKATVPTK